MNVRNIMKSTIQIAIEIQVFMDQNVNNYKPRIEIFHAMTEKDNMVINIQEIFYSKWLNAFVRKLNKHDCILYNPFNLLYL